MFSWDHLRTTQQAVTVAVAPETWVYPKSGVATVLLTQITAFWNMSPCRYISRRNSVCFPLLHLKCHRGADVFILTSSVVTAHLKYTQHCSVGSLERCTEYGFPWPFDVCFQMCNVWIRVRINIRATNKSCKCKSSLPVHATMCMWRHELASGKGIKWVM